MCAAPAVAPTIDMGRDIARRELNARYLEYLNDYHRRLRKQVGSPTNDAAGLLGGAKYQGRRTPLKGHGLPPCDKQELQAEARRRKAYVPGHSGQPTDVLLVSRPGTADSVHFRPAKRMLNHSFASSLSGGAVAVTVEPGTPRRSRGEGAASPDRTIIMTKKHLMNEGYSSGELRCEDHYGRRAAQIVRPATAGVDSVIRHRYSLPDTAPSPCMLDCKRVATPTTSPFNEAASRDSFYDALTEYAYNKSRATFGSHFKLG